MKEQFKKILKDPKASEELKREIRIKLKAIDNKEMVRK